MVYKSLHELAPKYMRNMFSRASQPTTRCLSNALTDLRLPKKSSKTGQKCLYFRGAKTWNGLSIEGKLTSSIVILNFDSSFTDAVFFMIAIHFS